MFLIPIPCKIVADLILVSSSVMIDISCLSESLAYFEIDCKSIFNVSDDSGFTIRTLKE